MKNVNFLITCCITSTEVLFLLKFCTSRDQIIEILTDKYKGLDNIKAAEIIDMVKVINDSEDGE